MVAADDTPGPSFIRYAAIVIAFLAITAPVCVLSAGGYFQIGEWPSAMAPFGFTRIATAYVLLSAPLVWWLALAIGRCCRPFWEAVALLAGLTGLVAVGMTLSMSGVSEQSMGTQWLERHFIRIGWVVALQIPFAISSSVLLFASGNGHRLATRRIRWLDFVLATTLILVVPMPFSDFVVRRQMSLIETAQRNLQRHTALSLTTRLNRFGCSLPSFPEADESISAQARALRQARNNLANEEERLRHQVAVTTERIGSAPPETDEERIGLALDMYSIGEFVNARNVLSKRELQTSHEWGALVMGYICEQQRQPAEAAKHYQRAIELESSTDSPRANRLSSAYERLANTLRASGQAAKAESMLKAGIERHANFRDRLEFQLAEHYAQAGRTQEAIDAFSSLAKLNDAIGLRSKSRIEDLKSSIGICFVRTN